jgi:hypothetical protein
MPGGGNNLNRRDSNGARVSDQMITMADTSIPVRWCWQPRERGVPFVAFAAV